MNTRTESRFEQHSKNAAICRTEGYPKFEATLKRLESGEINVVLSKTSIINADYGDETVTNFKYLLNGTKTNNGYKLSVRSSRIDKRPTLNASINISKHKGTGIFFSHGSNVDSLYKLVDVVVGELSVKLSENRIRSMGTEHVSYGHAIQELTYIKYSLKSHSLLRRQENRSLDWD